MRRLKWEIAQWFELRWWQSYLRNKNKEEYSGWKKNYWNNILELISAAVKLDHAHTICDLGCGPAGVFIAVPHHPTTAVDPLINKYEKHTSFFKKNEYPNCTFVESTIEEFETEKEFDVVFCMNAINHVHTIEKGFSKLKTLCSENGKIVVSIDAHNFPFFKHLFRAIPGDVLHPHQYDLEEYKSLLKNEGLTILQTSLLKHEFFFDHYLIVAGK